MKAYGRKLLRWNDYGEGLTPFDLLKSFALFFMIVDHIGFYFFPEAEWWRVLGRFCVPVWFFLIGYAGAKKVPLSWWLGALLVLIAGLLHAKLLPLNILFTLALCRLFITYVLPAPMFNRVLPQIVFAFILLLLALPTSFALDYGTMGFGFCLLGYACRQQMAQKVKLLWAITSVGIFVPLEVVLFGFNGLQAVVLLLGISLIVWALLCFPFKFEINKIFQPVIQFMGRRTLEIYVLHIWLFTWLIIS